MTLLKSAATEWQWRRYFSSTLDFLPQDAFPNKWQIFIVKYSNSESLRMV